VLTIPELLDANLHGVFGATNDANRLRAAEQAYSPDVTFTDPEGTFVGLQAVVTRAKTLADDAPRDWRFTDEGPIYSDQDSAALAWSLGPPNAEPAARGIDIVTMAAGRITTITTLLVQQPTDGRHETTESPSNEGKNMTDLEIQAALSEARKAASAASYHIQKLPEDSIERQALHNLLNAVDYLIQAQTPSDDAA
jgi:hypothetical protein